MYSMGENMLPTNKNHIIPVYVTFYRSPHSHFFTGTVLKGIPNIILI
jgi:hypothetical protein